MCICRSTSGMPSRGYSRCARSRAFGALLLLMLSSTARAAVSFQWSSDKTSYNLLPNGTATVDVYLRETLSDGSASLLVQEGGLALQRRAARPYQCTQFARSYYHGG